MNRKKELDVFEKRFKKIEKLSIKYQYGKNEYLIIRLDGERFTYKYARKEFIPQIMVDFINSSIFKTY